MRLVIAFMAGLVAFLLCLTLFFWRKKRKLQKKSYLFMGKRIPKFDLIEVSAEDEKYNEYYEPRIIETIPTEEDGN